MKTTSLDISRKLKDIGFDAETNCYWDEHSQECQVWFKPPNREHFIKGFLLETILEALPKEIDSGYLSISCLDDIERFIFCYAKKGDLTYNEIEIEQPKGESLADTAARLLILLVEKEIVKFNKE